MPEQSQAQAAAASKSKHSHAASSAQPAPRKVRFNVGEYILRIKTCSRDIASEVKHGKELRSGEVVELYKRSGVDEAALC